MSKTTIMQEDVKPVNDRMSVIVFIAAWVVALFWILAQVIDVYAVAVIGAIFEMCGLPMLALAVIIPFYAIFRLWKSGFSFRSLYFYSILVVLVGLTFMFVFLRP